MLDELHRVPKRRHAHSIASDGHKHAKLKKDAQGNARYNEGECGDEEYAYEKQKSEQCGQESSTAVGDEHGLGQSRASNFGFDDKGAEGGEE